MHFQSRTTTADFPVPRKAANSEPTHSGFQRWISRLLIVTMTSLALQPLSAAAQAQATAAKSAVAVRHLEIVEDAVKRVLPDAWPKAKGQKARAAANDDDLAVAAQTLLQQADAVEAEADGMEIEFAAIDAELMAKALPPEILARHAQTVADFQTRRADYRRHLQAIDIAVGGKQNFLASALGFKPQAANPAGLRTALTDLARFLARHPNKKQHTASDPNNLPWGTPKHQTREPIESAVGYKLSRLFPQDTVKLAQLGGGIPLPPSAGATPTGRLPLPPST